jgi:hypothetical protein
VQVISGTHTFASGGIYAIGLTVTDVYGTVVVGDKTVQVGRVGERGPRRLQRPHDQVVERQWSDRLLECDRHRGPARHRRAADCGRHDHRRVDWRRREDLDVRDGLAGKCVLRSGR